MSEVSTTEQKESLWENFKNERLKSVGFWVAFCMSFLLALILGECFFYVYTAHLFYSKIEMGFIESLFQALINSPQYYKDGLAFGMQNFNDAPVAVYVYAFYFAGMAFFWALFFFLKAVISTRTNNSRGTVNLYGSARWATIPELVKANLIKNLS
ncbi:hypothetical protein [Helicobacter suis]|uniref:hypothetical protein n=1 Tax=Helicobacter suis TaxID=104628 RepID=UPI0013D55504|nr:hypothetical protein [Helicobacter suis]